MRNRTLINNALNLVAVLPFLILDIVKSSHRVSDKKMHISNQSRLGCVDHFKSHKQHPLSQYVAQ